MGFLHEAECFDQSLPQAQQDLSQHSPQNHLEGPKSAILGSFVEK